MQTPSKANIAVIFSSGVFDYGNITASLGTIFNNPTNWNLSYTSPTDGVLDITIAPRDPSHPVPIASTNGGTLAVLNIPIYNTYIPSTPFTTAATIAIQSATVYDNTGNQQNYFTLEGPPPYLTTININPLPQITTTLNNLVQGVNISQQLATMGGTGPMSFSVTSGNLPTGMYITPTGLFAGTPTTTGTFSFTVTATDISGSSGSQDYVLSVGPFFTLAGLQALGNFDSGGANPFGALVQDSQGNYWGTTEYGGPYGDGTVFLVPADSENITIVASFNGSNGANPTAGLSIDGYGNLFGTTTAGAGTVFEIPAGTENIVTLASFDGNDGSTPYGGVIPVGGGLLGTTFAGGAYGYGTVFRLDLATDLLSDVYSFQGADGANPYAGLVADGSGNLYGVTQYGGVNFDPTNPLPTGYGTVFEVQQNGTFIANLASFDGTGGANPQGGLIVDGYGNVYGTTPGGPVDYNGTIFKIVVGSSTITTIATFTDGSDCVGGLLMDSSGNIFGTTAEGGSNGGVGTVFELPYGTSTIITLGSFSTGTGNYPQAGLILDSNGNVLGVAPYAGANGDGTFFVYGSILLGGQVGVAYYQTLQAVGGSGQFTYSISGYLPGLTMSEGGVLTGTPTEAGSFSITVTVTDNVNMDSITRNYTIIIAPNG